MRTVCSSLAVVSRRSYTPAGFRSAFHKNHKFENSDLLHTLFDPTKQNRDKLTEIKKTVQKLGDQIEGRIFPLSLTNSFEGDFKAVSLGLEKLKSKNVDGFQQVKDDFERINQKLTLNNQRVKILTVDHSGCCMDRDQTLINRLTESFTSMLKSEPQIESENINLRNEFGGYYIQSADLNERPIDFAEQWDSDGNPVFLLKLCEYLKTHCPEDLEQAEHFYRICKWMPHNSKYEGKNLIHYCSMYPKLKHLLKKVLNDGLIDPNEPSDIGESAIHMAVRTSNFHAVKLLLNDPRIDKQIRNHLKQSPIHCSVYWNNPSMLCLLLDQGCTVQLDETEDIMETAESPDKKKVRAIIQAAIAQQR